MDNKTSVEGLKNKNEGSQITVESSGAERRQMLLDLAERKIKAESLSREDPAKALADFTVRKKGIEALTSSKAIDTLAENNAKYIEESKKTGGDWRISINNENLVQIVRESTAIEKAALNPNTDPESSGIVIPESKYSDKSQDSLRAKTESSLPEKFYIDNGPQETKMGGGHPDILTEAQLKDPNTPAGDVARHHKAVQTAMTLGEPIPVAVGSTQKTPDASSSVPPEPVKQEQPAQQEVVRDMTMEEYSALSETEQDAFRAKASKKFMDEYHRIMRTALKEVNIKEPQLDLELTNSDKVGNTRIDIDLSELDKQGKTEPIVPTYEEKPHEGVVIEARTREQKRADFLERVKNSQEVEDINHKIKKIGEASEERLEQQGLKKGFFSNMFEKWNKASPGLKIALGVALAGAGVATGGMGWAIGGMALSAFSTSSGFYKKILDKEEKKASETGEKVNMDNVVGKALLYGVLTSAATGLLVHNLSDWAGGLLDPATSAADSTALDGRLNPQYVVENGFEAGLIPDTPPVADVAIDQGMDNGQVPILDTGVNLDQGMDNGQVPTLDTTPTIDQGLDNGQIPTLDTTTALDSSTVNIADGFGDTDLPFRGDMASPYTGSEVLENYVNLGEYTIQSGDNLTNIMKNEVISTIPGAENLTDLQKENMIQNLLKAAAEHKGTEGVYDVINKFSNPDLIHPGETVDLDAVRKLLTDSSAGTSLFDRAASLDSNTIAQNIAASKIQSVSLGGAGTASFVEDFPRVSTPDTAPTINPAPTQPTVTNVAPTVTPVATPPSSPASTGPVLTTTDGNPVLDGSGNPIRTRTDFNNPQGGY